MKNGALREWLTRTKSRDTISCKKRIQIALDVANGLHYLHNFTKPGYIHKNINSRNILLDSNIRAKIANFTLAKETNTSGTTWELVGKKGYMAPEYIETGSVTSKLDIYAFGVVLLESVTGKDAVIVEESGEILLSVAVAAIMEGENTETETEWIHRSSGAVQSFCCLIKVLVNLVVAIPRYSWY